jgi:hypothetical protein
MGLHNSLFVRYLWSGKHVEYLAFPCLKVTLVTYMGVVFGHLCNLKHFRAGFSCELSVSFRAAKPYAPPPAIDACVNLAIR